MEKLESLECPFSWGFDDVKVGCTTEYKSHDDEESLPVLQLMRKLMKLYADVKNLAPAFEENDDLLVKLTECESLLTTMRKSDSDGSISIDVVDHVVQATRAFVLSKMHMTVEMEKILENIIELDTSEKKIKSSLLGCKSMCWAAYARVHEDNAEKFIREAIREDPDCHIWHFILGKVLRNKRRDLTFGTPPSYEEGSSFNKAYALAKIPIYGIFLAQMYREKHSKERAYEIYEQIFRQKPESTVILLRLALGLMAFKEMEKAKKCLDKVAETSEKNSMFLHYQGIYYLKLQQYWTAAKYFQDAAKVDNLGADYQYIECMLKVDKFFNVSQYLVKMLEKYKHLPDKQIQPILLDLAFLSWKTDKNIPDSLKYFRRALKIDLHSRPLTNYNPWQIGLKLRDKNVFRMVEKELLPIAYKKYSTSDILEMANDIKKMCSEHHSDRHRSAMKSLDSLALR
ncbi:hypothetical protein QAD02_017574 [Eretmocerus hayati]|uniref:Uncharacterized protein n=1 Tax=Eretmocerus hayati TaxID=131215 RepID=A0ACC2PEA4_9HYME|nr:hypothetical protein QAD02_017574 [Eretmocerus hayati]